MWGNLTFEPLFSIYQGALKVNSVSCAACVALLCVCVSVLLAWLARCSVLTVGSVVAGVSAFSRASAKKLSASFPSRLCGLSGSWFACDCLRYFLNAYSSCVCGFNHTIKTSLGLPVGNLHGNWSSPASVCTAVTLVLLLQTCKQVVGRAARRYI